MMQTANSIGLGDWPAWLALFLSSISLIWQIINRILEWQNKKEEKISLLLEKEFQRKNKKINDYIDRLFNICRLSTLYWAADHNNDLTPLYVNLSLELNDLSLLLKDNEDILWTGIGTDYRKIRKAITKCDTYGTPNKATYQHNNEYINSIIIATNDFVQKLRNININD